MYMGGRHSWFRRRHFPRPTPKPTISIPNFNYPKFIFSYLMSQSGKYNIVFTTPSGQIGNVTMPPTQPEPADTSAISSTAAPIATAAATTRPAYSTGLSNSPFTNTSGGIIQQSDSSTRQLSPSPYVAPGVPPFWVAAIWAMSLTDDIGEINDYNTLNLFYKTVAEKINEIMGDGSNAEKNVSALIYFCTVVTILFNHFLENFTYNYLNTRFPKIFNDVNTGSNPISGASKYNKVVMVNYYSNHASDILKPTRFGYIPVSDGKVMKYAVPDIMNSIIELLTDKTPLSDI